MYTTRVNTAERLRSPAPFSVTIKKSELVEYKDLVMSDQRLINPLSIGAFFHNHDKMMGMFDGKREMRVVYPLPGFRYTTDKKVADTYFKELK